jgi:hypothetical protein
MHTKLLHKCTGCKRMVFTNSEGLKWGQFEIGNMWSGISPSYRNWQRYCCWEIRQPKRVLPVQWCHRLILWILWDYPDSILESLDWTWGISSSPGHCDPLTWSRMIFFSGVPFTRNAWKQENLVSLILAECGTVPDTTEVCERVLQKMVRRCSSCSEVGGRHFEELV